MASKRLKHQKEPKKTDQASLPKRDGWKRGVFKCRVHDAIGYPRELVQKAVPFSGLGAKREERDQKTEWDRERENRKKRRHFRTRKKGTFSDGGDKEKAEEGGGAVKSNE